MTLVIATTPASVANAQERGGAYIIFEIDAATLHRQQLENVAHQMAAALRNASPPIRFAGPGVDGNHAQVKLTDPADLERARSLIRGIADDPSSHLDFLTFSVGDDGLIEAELTPTFVRNLIEHAARQSMEVIRRRADPTGTGDVQITRQSDARILVRAPHTSDPQELRRSVGLGGQLTFHLVRDAADEVVTDEPPPGTMVAQPHPQSTSQPEIIERRALLNGGHLVRANPSADEQTGEFVLSFQLNAAGARLFCDVTQKHTGERFAVLLDGQLLTAPTINEPICGGSGQISGGFTAQAANDLAVLLRPGLPAPLNIVEQGVMPPN